MRDAEYEIILPQAIMTIPPGKHVRIADLSVIFFRQSFGDTNIATQGITSTFIIDKRFCIYGLYGLVVKLFIPSFECQFKIGREIIFIAEYILYGPWIS